MKGMWRRFLVFSVFTYYGGGVAYFVSFYGFQNSLGSEGKIQSLYTVGLALQISLLMFVNVLMQTNIKDYNCVMKIFVIGISMQMPLTLVFVNNWEKEALYRNVPEVISDPKFWLIVLLITFLLMFPYMIYRRFSQIIFSDRIY